MTDRDHPEKSKSEPSAGAPDASRAEIDESEPSHALAPLDFATFVMSLGSSAMVNLGHLPPPEGTEPRVDISAAKQIIDILGMLEEKTRGNLDDSEEKLLKSLLYDLRVQYVDAQRE